MARLAAVLVLTALLAAPSANAQTPPNDTAAGAVRLQLNQPAAGDLGAASDDYRLSGNLCFGGIGQTAVTANTRDIVYRFVAPSAGAYDFRLVEQANTGTNPVVYVASDLPEPPGAATVTTCLGASNRNEIQAAEEVSGLSLAAGQQVFVVADSHGLGMTANPSPVTVVVERTVTGDLEPNDGTGFARPRVCGATGSIGEPGDVDFYSVGGQPSGTRLFALVDGAAAPGSDLDLRATTATDTLEFDDQNADFRHGLLAPLLAGTPVGNTPSFLRVSHGDAAQASEPYRLYSVVMGPGFTNAESEPNNSLADADPSPVGYATGAIASTSDDDVWTFSAPAGGLMLIVLDTDPTSDPTRDNTPFDGALELLDANGNTVAAVDDSGSTSSVTPSAGTLTGTTPRSPGEAMAVRLPVGGRYHVRVSDSGSVGNYFLSMSYACRSGLPPAPIDIAPPGLSGGTQGTPYSQALSASGGLGSHSFTVSSGALPPGLTLGADGTLTGTPTEPGTFSFTAVATDADEAFGERAYTLEVAAAPVAGPGPGPGPGPAPGPGQGTTTPADTDPPQTRITKKPKKKLRARRASFSFSSDERGSTFRCKIDKKRFGSCKSPKKYALKPGKHTFQVRATDAAGNVDRSPAKYAFRVLRPKR